MAGHLKIGKRVYIEELETYGTVHEIQEGRVKSVEIKTPTGPQIIEVIKYTIVFITYLEQLIAIIRRIWANNFVKNK